MKIYPVTYCLILSFLSSTISLSQILVDDKASMPTRNLYKNMISLSKKGVMVGQQDGTYMGISWRGHHNRSDMKDLTGSHPAIIGWDLGKIEIGAKINFDRVPFDSVIVFSKRFYASGGINTFSWHSNNPLNPTLYVKSKRITNTVEQILNNPSSLKKFNASLDSISVFIEQLKDEKGELIPILFRPFHENTGNFFWWGSKMCTPDQYKKIWRHTVHYLRDIKGLHNIIYVYCTSRFSSKQEFLERYPGDDFVDVLGFDIYDYDQYHKGDSDKFKARLLSMVDIVSSVGKAKKKPFAITETGYKQMPKSDWWTQTLLPVLANSGLSYILIWVNSNYAAYWGTFPGQSSANDFIEFYKNKTTLFHSDIQKNNIYD